MKTFRVYFRDGNQKLFVARNMYQLFNHLYFELDTEGDDIYKVEEVKE